MWLFQFVILFALILQKVRYDPIRIPQAMEQFFLIPLIIAKSSCFFRYDRSILLWRKYVTKDRVQNLAINKNVVNEIIEPGYIDRLMPERRFDQTLYFTMRGNH